jgi:DNA-binding NarL/FixJ family response regulator
MSTSNPPSSRAGTGAKHLALLSAMRKRIQDEDLKVSILIVEDERVDAGFIETPLGRLFGARARFDLAQNLTALTERLKKNRYDVVLLDDRLEGKPTAEIALESIRIHAAQLPVIVVSRLVTRQRTKDLMRLGVHAVIAKEDIDPAMLGQIILDAITRPA